MRTTRRLHQALKTTALLCTLVIAALLLALTVDAAEPGQELGQPVKVIQYDWLTQGEKSGSQSVRYYSDNRVLVDFEFTDRGRGPKIRDLMQLDDKGMLIEQKITGNSYMGAEVDEQFSITKGVAKWQGPNGPETAKLDGPALYIPMNSAPEFATIMLKAILADSDGQVATIPAGTVSAEAIANSTVTVADQSKTITLYAFTGLGFTPQYAWFDADNQLFAVDYGWMGMTQSGWSAALPQIRDTLEQAKQDYLISQSAELTQKADGKILITNINLFDSVSAKLQKNQSVLLEDGKISAVGAANFAATDAKIINGNGMTLMAGLWDMHAHVSLNDGMLNIAAGVTTVRDLANDHDSLMNSVKLYDSGQVIGPRVHKAGFIDKKSPYTAPTGNAAKTLEEVIGFIEEYHQLGYPQVKIYSSIEPEWVKPIAAALHERGMKLSGHIPSFMTAEQAVNDGYDEIQHINMLLLNFLAGPEDDTRTPVRFTLVGEQAGTLDLDSKAVKDFVALLKQKDIVVDPTVSIFDSMFTHFPGEVNPSFSRIAEHMPTNVRRGLFSPSLKITDEQKPAYLKSAATQLALIKMLHDAGVTLVAGTDDLAGFTLHRELELYSQAGIPNAEVLKLATIGSARVVGSEKEFGSVEVGKTADLILLDGNPLEDINALRRVALVIKGEQMHSPSAIYQAMGIKPFTDLSVQRQQAPE